MKREDCQVAAVRAKARIWLLKALSLYTSPKTLVNQRVIIKNMRTGRHPSLKAGISRNKNIMVKIMYTAMQHPWD